jgi:hypothetical protein
VKERLVRYNSEDCAALELVTQIVTQIMTQGIGPASETTNSVEVVASKIGAKSIEDDATQPTPSNRTQRQEDKVRISVEGSTVSGKRVLQGPRSLGERRLTTLPFLISGDHHDNATNPK